LLPPEPLRYYFAGKLSAGIDDIDLNLDDFVARVNSDIVGKLVNIASRCAGFVQRAGGTLGTSLPEPALYQEFADARTRIGELYDARDYSAAIREIMLLADKANQYVDARKPWAMAKEPARAAEVLGVCTQGINLFRVLMSYLAPVLPQMACAAAKFLGDPLADWQAVARPLLGTPLAPYEPLATRIDPKVAAQLIEPAPAAADGAKKVKATAAAAPPATITIEDFMKLDLRVAKVSAARTVEGSDKLLELTLDVGGVPRTVFSGIRSAYAPEQLVGRQVLLIANLAPRKMRFGTSEGMVLCASGDGPGVYLLSPDGGAESGMKVS
jgi:methionyl-tRNA synthetase